MASPWDLAFHPDDSKLVIAMAGTHQLWSLDFKSNQIDVIAGSGEEGIKDGLPVENNLAQPSGLGSLLGNLYFVDAESSSLRFYFETYVRTLVGTGLFDFGMKDGDRKKAQLQHPLGLYADVSGIYVADTYNHSIRRYDPKKQTLETVVGSGTRGESPAKKPEDAKAVEMNEPNAIIKLSDAYYVISDTNNHRLLLWDRAKDKVERMRIEGERAPDTMTDEARSAKGSVAPRKRINPRLPNTVAAGEARVNSRSPEINFILPEMYKINADAPSYARLFEGPVPNETFKQEWKTDELKGLKLKLSELADGKPYILQGTLYYCLDAKNALCEIASFNKTIKVDPAGAATVDIEIPRTPVEPEPSPKAK
jgi:hypothetical protein